MVHVRIAGNRITIVKKSSSGAEITVADSHVDISGDTIVRLEVDNAEISIRKDSPQQNLFDKGPFLDKKNLLRDNKGHFVKPSDALSSADYIERAIKQHGKPFKSVKDIMPLVLKTDFQTTSNDPLNIVRSSIHNDKRFTKTDDGLWTLVQWLEDERQQEFAD